MGKKKHSKKETRKKAHHKKNRKEQYSGVVSLSGSGIGVVFVKELNASVLIPARFVGTAMDGDTVAVSILENDGKRYIGKITGIIKRNRTRIAGNIYYDELGSAYLKPSIKNSPIEILIEDTNSDLEGKKAIVELTQENFSKKILTGRIIKVLGDEGDIEAEINSILLNHGIKTEFEEETLKEAEKVPEVIPPLERQIRKNLSDIPTFAIDPENARDHDDALSLRCIDSKNKIFEVGVHIADVSFYVNEGGWLDREAKIRGNSTYLPDRAIPMLPERLSTNVCSLLPGKERLAFSIIFLMDENARVLKYSIEKTIIKSRYNFTYPEVDQILEGKRDHPLKNEIKILGVLAEKLRKKRINNDAIAITSSDLIFKLNENKEPVGIIIEDYTMSHIIIEEFMVLANQYIAEHVAKNLKKPFIYRVHPTPEEHKMEKFALFAKAFGYRIDWSNPVSYARTLNRMFEKLEKKEYVEREILSYLAVRSLPRAVYSADNIGHYGLGLAFYTHFTSPIRRYSDLLAHRLLFKYSVSPKYAFHKDELDEICAHLTERETSSMYAELDSIDLFMAIYMKKYLNKNFYGIVADINEKAIIVKVKDTGARVNVPLLSLKDDLYIYRENEFAAVGFNSRKKIKTGSSVVIRITGIDMASRSISGEIVKVV